MTRSSVTTLTAENGTWSNAPSSFRYQWVQCDRFGGTCVDVPGATGKTYGVRFADVYGTLRVDVTARNSSGATTRRSTPSDVVEPLPPTTVPGNKAPTITFLSLKRLGQRVYARFRVCDDAAKGVTVVERDSKAGASAYVRRFTVTPNRCVVATRSWVPAPRFRTKGRFVVTLRAIDKSRASSRFVSRSLVRARRRGAPRRSDSQHSDDRARSRAPSSSESVRSADWNATENATDFLPAGICSPR